MDSRGGEDVDRRREALVGLVVVTAVALFIAGTIWLQGGWRSDQVPVRAAVATAGQLVEGAAVKFRGVAVGRVESVSVLPSGEAVMIEMTVRPDLAVPDDAAALIAPESMFGDWQVEIIRRSEYRTHPFHEHDGEGVLPGAALPDFSRLTATADEIAQRLTTIAQRFEVAFTEETAQNLGRAIDNLGTVSDRLSEVVTQQADRFDDLADGVDASARELGAAARAARLSFERVDGIIAGAGVEEMILDAGRGVANVRALTEEMEAGVGDLRSAARSADATFARLDEFLAALESEDGSLGRLLTDPTLAQSAVETVEELKTLLADLRENPGRYLSFSIF